MNIPTISAIIPVYNTGKYIEKCICSILSQSFTDFELILIDDGSTDGSGEICDQYAQKDNRIIVIHKKNGGVSSARNVGLDNAHGKWIIFIDSDDYISTDFFTLDENFIDCDVIEKNFEVIKQNGQIVKRRRKLCEMVLSERDSFYRYYLKERNNSLCNKFISRRLIDKIRFDESIRIGEDLLFFLSLVDKIEKYGILAKGVYYYVRNEESAMSKLNNDINERMDKAFLLNSKISELVYDARLKFGLIYQNNLYFILKHLSFLNLQQQNKALDIYKSINKNNMALLPVTIKMKLYLLKSLYFLCKK